MSQWNPAMIDAVNPRLDDDDDDEGCPSHEGGKGKKGEESLALKLLKSRTILIAKAVDKELMQTVTAQLLLMSTEDTRKPITVYVNSPGGDADSGFAIYDMMRYVKAPVRTVCAGLCASAGIIIFLGGDKGQRFTLPNSRFLIHQPSTYAQGQASDLEITAKQILLIRQKYNEIVGKETGRSADQVTKDANRDFWLDANEAKAYKLVDKIVTEQGEID
jgi:ATP-dependent Clp protease, protease subunit